MPESYCRAGPSIGMQASHIEERNSVQSISFFIESVIFPYNEPGPGSKYFQRLFKKFSAEAGSQSSFCESLKVFAKMEAEPSSPNSLSLKTVTVHTPRPNKTLEKNSAKVNFSL